MPRELRTEIVINASADKVWNQLMDFESYPDWNPFVKAIIGKQMEGERLTAELQPNGGRGMIIRPKISEISPNERFAWKGKLFVPRLFDGEHIFEIESISEDQVRFIHREKFRGLLMRPILRSVGENTRRGFEEMNQALKKKVENSI
ncbi:MAG: SRPBCC family protein [Candidatus Heimdallarchaeota archaeon]